MSVFVFEIESKNRIEQPIAFENDEIKSCRNDIHLKTQINGKKNIGKPRRGKKSNNKIQQ